MRFLKLSVFLLGIILIPGKGVSQKFYQGSEMTTVFSVGMLERKSIDLKTPVRFTPYVNIGHLFHLDFTRSIGLYTGLELKNVGVIIKDTLTTKHRAYSAGLFVAAKAGRMDKDIYFFAGGSYEYFFAYKEKIFVNNEKIKRKNYYKQDVNQFIPALFAGINVSGMSFRVHYYLDDFFSDKYQFVAPSGQQYPSFNSSRLLLFMVGFRRTIPDVYNTQKKKVKDNTLNARFSEY